MEIKIQLEFKGNLTKDMEICNKSCLRAFSNTATKLYY